VAIWSGLAGLGLDAIGQDVEHFRHVWIMLGLADADRRGENRRVSISGRRHVAEVANGAPPATGRAPRLPDTERAGSQAR
jgi:hypothetical protein